MTSSNAAIATPSRLGPDGFASIGGDLLEQLQRLFDAFSCAVTRTHQGNVVIDDFPHTPAGHRLRLLTQMTPSRISVALYVGDGHVAQAYGIVESWVISESFPDLSLNIVPTHMLLIDGRAEGTPVELRLDDPIAQSRPGYNPSLPTVADDILEAVQCWREHRFAAAND